MENISDEKPWLFKAGQVVNPHGRPPEVKHVKELARQWTVEAIQTLGRIMTDKSEKGSARVAAANALLDRGYGRAPLTFDDPPEEITDLREAARKLAFLMNGAIIRGDSLRGEVLDVEAVEVEAATAPLVESESKKKPIA